MMDTNTILALADEQAARAKRRATTPYVPWDAAEIESGEALKKIPNIGTYRPEGWQLDSSGTIWPQSDAEVGPDGLNLSHLLEADKHGSNGGPAATLEQVKTWLLRHDALDQTFGFAIIEESEFQVVLGAFERVGEEGRLGK